MRRISRVKYDYLVSFINDGRDNDGKRFHCSYGDANVLIWVRKKTLGRESVGNGALQPRNSGLKGVLSYLIALVQQPNNPFTDVCWSLYVRNPLTEGERIRYALRKKR